jgi:hypothetical protein
MHSVKSKTSRLSGPPHSLGHNNFPARHIHSSTAAQHRDNVQAWVADDREDDDLTYVEVTCLACAPAHLVNPKTGEVLGSGKE